MSHFVVYIAEQKYLPSQENCLTLNVRGTRRTLPASPPTESLKMTTLVLLVLLVVALIFLVLPIFRFSLLPRSTALLPRQTPLLLARFALL